MKGDFSRNTFSPGKHFSGVRLQQGRVQLDSDWNEQLDIQAHRDRAEAVDAIGQSGAPKEGGGFKLQLAPGNKDILILPGRMYVGGLLVELEGGFIDATKTDAKQATLASANDARLLAPDQWFEATAQGEDPHYLKIDSVAGSVVNFSADLFTGLATNTPVRLRPLGKYSKQAEWTPGAPDFSAAGNAIAYLDVWQRHISGVEDPSILEPALGGPDTATRSKTVWQVKLLLPVDGGASFDCQSDAKEWNNLIAPSTGLLSARSKPDSVNPDPCIIPTRAGFRSLENQLYLVEIHDPGALNNKATFKWSRDNGSQVAPWLKLENNVITLHTTGHDDALGFAPDQWVELTDDTLDLAGKPGQLVQLATAEGLTLTVKQGTVIDFTQFPVNPKVRRWDSAGALTVKPGTAGDDQFLKLENGVQIKFEDGQYATGDYWLIPARTIIGDVDWPAGPDGKPLPQPRRGIEHHYARLAALTTKIVSGKLETSLADCRLPFPPLTAITAEDVSVSSKCDLLADAKTVQKAIDLLCEEKDLRFHNQHLHGWGIVCGLEVVCGPDTVRADKSTLHDRVTVQQGYAIDSRGVDIQIAQGDVLPILDWVKAGKFLDDPKNPGKLLDGEVCLTLKLGDTIEKRYALEAFTPPASVFDGILEGTIWDDFWDGCVMDLVNAVKKEFTLSEDDKRVVGPVSEHITTFINLLWLFANQKSGRNIYVSPEEDDILRTFYNKLRDVLKSKTFCAMFDQPRARPFPTYDFLNLDGETAPSTIFSKLDCQAVHRRLRVNPAGTFACSVGYNSIINVYDVQYDPPGKDANGNPLPFPNAHEKLVAEVPFPTAGAVLQDVALSKDGKIYALAIQNNKDSLFAAGDFSDPANVKFDPVSVICDTPLVALGIASNGLYALGTGTTGGLFLIDPKTIIPNKPNRIWGPAAGSKLGPTGQLYILDLFDSPNAFIALGEVAPKYTQVIRVDLKSPSNTLLFDLGANPTYRAGSDDLVVTPSGLGPLPPTAAFRTDRPVLYVVADGVQPRFGLSVGGNKQLLRYSALTSDGPASATLDLGSSGNFQLAYDGSTARVLILDTDASLLKSFSARSEGMVLDTPLPVQIAPTAVAVAGDAKSSNVFVLNAFTLNNIPAAYPGRTSASGAASPVVDLVKLALYRARVFEAFIDLLGGVLQYLKDCFCDHLLVNCPKDEQQTLYLACLVIKNQQIYKICNFSKRKYVHSFPTVEYWMSVVPALPLLKKVIESACCSVLTPLFGNFKAPGDNQQDRFSASQGLNGLQYLRQQNFGGQLQSLLLGKLGVVGPGIASWFGDKTARQPMAAPAPAATVAAGSDILNRPVNDSQKMLTDRNVQVAGTEAYNPAGHLTGVLAAPAQLKAGDRVLLLTNASGDVVGYKRADAAVGPAADPRVDKLGAQIDQLKSDQGTQLQQHDQKIGELKSALDATTAAQQDALKARDVQIAQLKASLDVMNAAHQEALKARDAQLQALSVRLDQLKVLPRP